MRSTVIKKVIMAVSGLIMIAFLLMHMYGNLKIFVSPESFDHYAHWLKGLAEDGVTKEGGLMYPIMPAGQFIIVFRAALGLAVILHVWSAASLARLSRKAAGAGYQHKANQVRTYSSRTMRWGGVIMLAFIIFHLLQFTVIPAQFGEADPRYPHVMVVHAFEQWWMVLIYLISMVLVCMHVRHGVWSALTTLGVNTSPNARKVLNIVAYVVAIVLFVGFMAPPLAIFFGIV
ncbi:MAG: succinate dehydrogenase cytochrome b subunit [Tessaracoccus sp.]